ncbi:MAG: kelch repeat-containing protein [Pseudomonadota bacterium]
MLRLILVSLALLPLGTTLASDAPRLTHSTLPALPVPVTNNAVTSVRSADGRQYLVSFGGLGAAKSHADTHARTFVYDGERWREDDPVPGNVGRLAGAAATVGHQAYVFGGYSVAEDGSETSTAWVHAFDPTDGRFTARAPMPVPVDDAVAVTYQDRYVYLISGWHDLGNVNLVQRYDARDDHWLQATPLPGPAVFGHAGAIVDDTILYCDGVTVAAHQTRRRDFRASAACYLGRIDRTDSRRIDWRPIDAHPGRPRYRMAAAGLGEHGAVLMVGGTANPYNYNGLGYDGVPASPLPGALLYDLKSGEWHALEASVALPTMDHRGLVPWRGTWVVIGGMIDPQRVTDGVTAYTFSSP